LLTQQIQDYVKLYDNIIDLNLCDSTVASLSPDKFEPHYYFNAITQERTQNEFDLEMSWNDIPQRQAVTSALFPAIDRYLTDIKSECFKGWQGYTPIRFNKYHENKKMTLHCDHIQDLFGEGPNGIPILSIVGELNDDYTGGEFIMWDTVIKIPKGSVLIFPSVFLYPHKVDPVITGTRYSYVSWVF
tara:strand:+ start:860 stop:1420 length:561 start_codon:yes stop_codon:yes gene_type:complete